MMGYMKVLTTPVGSIPQAYLIFRRKMTKGMAIKFVYLDTIGSIASIFDVTLDSLNST